MSYYLTCGIFFILIRHAMLFNGEYRGDTLKRTLSQEEEFPDFVRIMDPDFIVENKQTMKSLISRYMHCEITTWFNNCGKGSTKKISFWNDNKIAEFNQLINKEYNKALLRMKEFSDKYIRGYGGEEWLVAALLELIQGDDMIPDKQVFCYWNDGKTKGELLKIMRRGKPVDFEPFLLSIYHYLINNRRDNRLGRNTVLKLCSTNNNNNLEFCSKIGIDRRGEITPVFVPESFFLDPKNVQENNKKVEINTYDLEARLEHFIEEAASRIGRVEQMMDGSDRSFFDVYVFPGLVYDQYVKGEQGYYKEPHEVEMLDLDAMKTLPRNMILSGSGGSGKTMMMRNLFLTTVKYNEYLNKIPIALLLREYGKYYDSFEDLFFARLNGYNINFSRKEMNEILESGKFVIFMDGLDEILRDHTDKFEIELEAFMRKYRKNSFVLSSRPLFDFYKYSEFTEVSLCDLTKEKAEKIVGNLTLSRDIHDRIKKDVDSLYDDESFGSFMHQAVTLILYAKTVGQYGSLPPVITSFYENAFRVLAHDHDNTKKGFERDFCTPFTTEKIEKYFAEFCAVTYKENVKDMLLGEFRRFYEQLKIRERDEVNGINVGYNDYLYDITVSIPLMAKVNDDIWFMHSSFQEYYCALYYANATDQKLANFVTMQEKRRRYPYAEQTFHMLYELQPNKVEKLIIYPYLKDLYEYCDEEVDDYEYSDIIGEEDIAYWRFLMYVYGTIEYASGDVKFTPNNIPKDLTLKHIYKEIDMLHCKISPQDIPRDYDFLVESYVSISKERWLGEGKPGQYEIVPESKIEDGFFDEDEEVDYVGWLYRVKIEDLFKKPWKHEEVACAINSYSCPLRKEFIRLRKYMEKLEIIVNDDDDDL